MNKIKDFIYNKNDIIIVLVIMLAAGLIIYDRMEAIMEYPDTVAAQTAVEEAEAQAETQQAAIVKITISKNNTLSDVSNMLADAGLVSSADEFTAYAEKQKKDNKIDIGEYEIPKGSDMKTILDMITK